MCIYHYVHQSGSQQKPTAPANLNWMAPCYSWTNRRQIDAMHLEPGHGRGKKPKWNGKDIAKKAKTDWHCKEKLLKEFREDLLKLKEPTRRVLLPPPGTEYEEVIHHIMFHQMDDRRDQKGWRTRHEPPGPI